MNDPGRPSRTEVVVRAFQFVVGDWGRTERTAVLMVIGGVILGVCGATAGPIIGIVLRTLLR